MWNKFLKRKKTVIIIALVLISLSSYFLLSNANENPEFTFDKIQKGDLLNSISCTGTLEPISSVDVGTELSGTVSQVFADFNDDVSKNQILTILDTTVLSINLKSALADQMKADANFHLNKLQYLTDKKLYKQKVISDLEFLTSEKNYKTAQAELITAKANVQKIKLNIEKYSIIRSPIDGKVINRSIEAGQTVAASLSAPTLFCIAENLENMEIYAYVDESDIGQVKKGMKASFTVEAFPEKSFTGTVKQIRLQPTVVSNVVNYTVIVEAKNDSGVLLPGMTATLEFIIQEKKDVFYINSYAFSYSPHLQAKKNPKEKNLKNQQPKNSEEELTKRLWYLDQDNQLKPLLVKVGMTSGTKVEIYGNDLIKEGQKIVFSQKNSNQKNRKDFGRRPRNLF